MIVKGVWLKDFRNYVDQAFNFSPTVTVLVGPNASGKTSVVEALHLMSTADSFRAGKIDEMIRFDQELGRVQVVASESEDSSNNGGSNEVDESFESGSNNLQLELMLTRGVVQGKKTHKRLYRVNNVKKRQRDFVGKLLSVAFRPEDMRLVEGSPARRRAFLDTPLSLIDYQYSHALKQYEKALRSRNKLLEHVRDRNAPRDTLKYWDKMLVEHGQYLQNRREEFISFFKNVEFPRNFSIEYNPSLISYERIEQYKDRAIAAGHTLIGPHKDDFTIFLETNREPFAISAYGSRGQQRLGVLWLKLGELAYLEEQQDQRPLLLLDDILSELDDDAIQSVIELMKQGQTIVTSADQTTLPLLKSQLGEVRSIALQ